MSKYVRKSVVNDRCIIYTVHDTTHACVSVFVLEMGFS